MPILARFCELTHGPWPFTMKCFEFSLYLFANLYEESGEEGTFLHPNSAGGLLSDKEEVDTVHCAGLQHCWSLSCCTSLLWLSLVIFIFVLSNYIVHVLHVTAIAWSQILSRKLSSVLWYCNRIPILIENIINRISYIRTTMYVIYFRWKHCSVFTPWDDPKLVECVNLQIQGVFLTGSPPKSSKYKKVKLG